MNPQSPLSVSKTAKANEGRSIHRLRRPACCFAHLKPCVAASGWGRYSYLESALKPASLPSDMERGSCPGARLPSSPRAAEPLQQVIVRAHKHPSLRHAFPGAGEAVTELQMPRH